MGNTKCLQKGRLFYSAPDSAMVSTRYAPREKKRPAERPAGLLSSKLNLFVSFGDSAMGSTRYVPCETKLPSVRPAGLS